MAYNRPSALTTGQDLTQTEFAKIPESIFANAFAIVKMGGSRSQALLTGGGFQSIPEWEDFSLPADGYTGHVWKLVWEVLTENVATAVTVRLYNVTDAVAAYTSGAITTTAWGTEQVSTAITIAASKVHRVQCQKSDDLFDWWVVAKLRRTDS